ncbi:MAG: ABC transporter substrate-binding protein [Acutalibacteraceae bacterium]|jgi:peptide/nickel transport system substrate-binding protein
MKYAKLINIAVALVLCASVCGCQGSPVNNSSDLSSAITSSITATNTANFITLLYSAADTYNPYTAKTEINRQLCRLLYDPLVKVDNNFNPVFCVAKSVDISGTECTVTLNSARFSDGSLVTAADVVYSFKLAKNSNTSYAAKLYGATSATEAGGKVVIRLTKSDPYFANVLDFPIVKSGSDTVKDADGVYQPPIGCGRYKLNGTKDGLIQNEFYFGKKGSIKEIRLINAPDSESVTHYTEVGAADMYFTDISDGNIMRMSGKKYNINLNNLVYIGINQNYAPLGERAMRSAISTALNRAKICEEAYYNNALPATGLFHPEWSETKAVQNIQIEANDEITVENLEEIGYNKLNSQGIRTNKSGIPLRFSLLVNSENRLRVLAARTVAKQLKNSGIDITVVEKSYSDYIESLKQGNFQLYIGEIKLTDNMDISPLIAKDGQAAFGAPIESSDENNQSDPQSGEQTQPKTTAREVLEGLYNGSNTIKDLASVLQTEMPIVPVCYRTGVLFCNKKIRNVNNSSLSDIFFSIDSYSVY